MCVCVCVYVCMCVCVCVCVWVCLHYGVYYKTFAFPTIIIIFVINHHRVIIIIIITFLFTEIPFIHLVGWLVGLDGLSFSQLVCWSVHRLVCQSVGWFTGSVSELTYRSVSRLVGPVGLSVYQSVSALVSQSVGWSSGSVCLSTSPSSVDRSVSQTIGRSGGRSV